MLLKLVIINRKVWEKWPNIPRRISSNLAINQKRSNQPPLFMATCYIFFYFFYFFIFILFFFIFILFLFFLLFAFSLLVNETLQNHFIFEFVISLRGKKFTNEKKGFSKETQT